MTVNKASNKAKNWTISLLALITLGVLGCYLYFNYYLEWQAIQKLRSEYEDVRNEAAEYLISVQSNKAVKYWEEQISEVMGSEYRTANGRIIVEIEDPTFNPDVIKLIHRIQPLGGEAIKRLVNHSYYRIQNFALNSVGELGVEGRLYYPTILDLSKSIQNVDTQSILLKVLAKTGSHDPEVVDHFCRLINLEKLAAGPAFEALPLLIKSRGFNSFKKLNSLIGHAYPEVSIKALYKLNSLGKYKYPKKSKVLIPTLFSLFQHTNRFIVEESITLLKKLPNSSFEELDDVHLKTFRKSSIQQKFIHLNFLIKAGPETKKVMESFVSNLENSSQASLYNEFLKGNSPGVETFAYYLKVSSEENQYQILKILDTHYSRVFLKALRKHLDSIGERALYLKVEKTFFK